MIDCYCVDCGALWRDSQWALWANRCPLCRAPADRILTSEPPEKPYKVATTLLEAALEGSVDG